ncbi:MAG: glycine zipper family protein [Planctomycetes bacterium]|nr:glycine zipper family protein [Planctomycetota bacterium]
MRFVMLGLGLLGAAGCAAESTLARGAPVPWLPMASAPTPAVERPPAAAALSLGEAEPAPPPPSVQRRTFRHLPPPPAGGAEGAEQPAPSDPFAVVADQEIAAPPPPWPQSRRERWFPVHTAMGAGIGAVIGHQSGHRGRGALVGGSFGLLLDLGRWVR